MNSKHKTLLITSILAFALLANVNVGAIYATGGLDDEEEEEAIETLQNAVEEINNSLDEINLNLEAGPNNIQANCPSVEEVVEEVVENITSQPIPEPAPEVNPEQNVTEPASCPVVEEQPEQNVTEPEPQQPPTTVIPPVQQNETEGCQPIPEPAVVEENETSELEPIICPINGELLGYLNTTSGEQLPISAGNGTNSFIPIIDIPIEEPEQPVQNNVTEQPVAELPSCNVTQGQEQQNQTQTVAPPEIQDEQEIATIEFEASCGCFVVDKSPEEVQ